MVQPPYAWKVTFFTMANCESNLPEKRPWKLLLLPAIAGWYRQRKNDHLSSFCEWSNSNSSSTSKATGVGGNYAASCEKKKLPALSGKIAECPSFCQVYVYRRERATPTHWRSRRYIEVRMWKIVSFHIYVIPDSCAVELLNFFFVNNNNSKFFSWLCG